jgi:hypothetical protein
VEGAAGEAVPAATMVQLCKEVERLSRLLEEVRREALERV